MLGNSGNCVYFGKVRRGAVPAGQAGTGGRGGGGPAGAAGLAAGLPAAGRAGGQERGAPNEDRGGGLLTALAADARAPRSCLAEAVMDPKILTTHPISLCL